MEETKYLKIKAGKRAYLKILKEDLNPALVNQWLLQLEVQNGRDFNAQGRIS